jgi:hypothetical protein
MGFNFSCKPVSVNELVLIPSDGRHDYVKGPTGTCILIRRRNKHTETVPIELCNEVIYCCLTSTDKHNLLLIDNYLWLEWQACVETSAEWWEIVQGI